MNKIIENIHNRRSVRQFEDISVPDDILKNIISAGNASPSGMNSQQWRFVVIKNRDLRKKLAGIAYPKYKAWLDCASEEFKQRRREIDKLVDDPVYYNAPVIIFVIGTGMTAPLDCPMVCQNIMLAARSYHIGSCWVYFGQMIFDNDEIKKIMNIKDTESIYGPIILGYPKDGFPESPPKKEPEILWM